MTGSQHYILILRVQAASSFRPAMTTEHRTLPAVDEADRSATVNESSSGNRRTQRKCHSAEINMLTNGPAVS
jgi:hypothetical protein